MARGPIRNAGADGYIRHRLGVVYLRLGRYPEAIEQLRKALSREPELADARFHLGECYRRLGDEKKAIESYAALGGGICLKDRSAAVVNAVSSSSRERRPSAAATASGSGEASSSTLAHDRWIFA